MEMNEDILMWLILLFVCTEFIWEQYLTLRQLRVYETNTTIPDDLKEMLNEESFKKSRLYGIDKSYYRLVKDLYQMILNCVMLYQKLYYGIWVYSEQIADYVGFSPDNEVAVTCIFCTLLTIVTQILNQPFSIYGTFVLEEKHGFNKQTVWFYIKDQVKSLFLSIAITVVIIYLCIVIIDLGGNMFVVWLWLVCSVISFIIATIYPSVIAPLFDKFDPLPDGTLRAGIEELAVKLNFPLSQVYIVEGSKRSAHSNAYFAGLFGAKRIVLFDTLIEKFDEEKKVTKGCKDAEILAVLAHELGHWSCGHIYKLIAVTEVNLLLLFAAFGALFQYSLLYTTIGFPPGKEPAIIGLIVVTQMILVPYHSILGFIISALSRRFEFEADNFAVALNFSDELRSALIKLGKDNLDYPVYDKIYSAWCQSHPPLLHRIENMRSQVASVNKDD